ncbi:c-type cytochrome [Candidatus Methylospira mobilis]|uniref:C-type cytochrome n=2 Tax=Candidatus Methylospira mobilis TaxID=1808979 RepID=A0A5Q0BLS0_9GAMM|nr:c-type cytochrome [Candidatus Methylospira mobilis]
MSIFGAYLCWGYNAQATEAAIPNTHITVQGPMISEKEAALIKRGEYVAHLGDCIACHTADKGAAMAGGREFPTPFGKVYSTNITPDTQAGIGKYSFAQFDRAMRKGVTADGHNLYPAMPYPSYAKMSEDDMRALYAYLQQGLAPINQPNQPSEMRWPFSMRWGLTFWNAAFLDAESFKPDTTKDAVWNRGAYLVQGLGHCGACHTPRGIAFQEKAMSDADSHGNRYLAGETVEAWHARSLRNLWEVEDTAYLLKTGKNRFTTVSGNMAEVIHHSTQHFTDADRTAIATYLKSLPPGENEQPIPESTGAATVPTDLYTTRGGLGYVQFCVACHRQDGLGVKDMFPPLMQNPTLNSADPSTLLHIMLTGGKTAETAAHPRVYAMPAFARLSDQELAEILNFVRAIWGHHAEPITASQIKKMRAHLNSNITDAALFDTPRLADMLTSPNAGQLIQGMRLHLETRALLPQNVGSSLNCTSCHLNVGTVADASPFLGVSAVFPGYAARSGRIITLEERINGCFERSMNGKPLPMDSESMKAMVAYFDWMKKDIRSQDKIAGRGVGKVDMSLKPNVENGRQVYATQCEVCHGNDGQGSRQAEGRVIYPPLWGDDSFNIGAGMARTYTAAAFVLSNMPVGFHQKFPLGQGGISEQDAVDVAAYFTHQPRPDFPGKTKDWPKDKKPMDARY